MTAYVKSIFTTIINFLVAPSNPDFVTLRGIIAVISNLFFSNENNDSASQEQADKNILPIRIAPINYAQESEETVLYRAVSYNQPNAVKKLINSGADVNAIDPSYPYAPLNIAVSRNVDISIIDALVTAGADVNNLDNRGYTLLHHAIEYKKNEIFFILLRKADINMRIKTPGIVHDDCTLLHYAIDHCSDLPIIQALIDAGADVNAIINPGSPNVHGSGGIDTRTPLQLSILRQNVEAIKALAAAGAQINLPIVADQGIQGGKEVTTYHDDLFALALSWEQVDSQGQPLPIGLPTLWALHDIGVRIDSEKTYKKILKERQFHWPVDKWQFIRPILFSYNNDPNCLVEKNHYVIDYFDANTQSLSPEQLDNIKGSFYWWALQIFKAKNAPDNLKQNPFIEFCHNDGDGVCRNRILTMLYGTSKLSNSVITAITNKLATNTEPFVRTVPRLTQIS